MTFGLIEPGVLTIETHRIPMLLVGANAGSAPRHWYNKYMGRVNLLGQRVESTCRQRFEPAVS